MGSVYLCAASICCYCCGCCCAFSVSCRCLPLARTFSLSLRRSFSLACSIQHSHLNKSFIQAYKYWNYNSNCRTGAVCVLARATSALVFVLFAVHIYAFNFDQIGKILHLRNTITGQPTQTFRPIQPNETDHVYSNAAKTTDCASHCNCHTYYGRPAAQYSNEDEKALNADEKILPHKRTTIIWACYWRVWPNTHNDDQQRCKTPVRQKWNRFAANSAIFKGPSMADSFNDVFVSSVNKWIIISVYEYVKWTVKR